MVVGDVRELVADSTKYFQRSTSSSEEGGLFILDTHCTLNKLHLRLKATKFHLGMDANLRQYFAAKCQMPPSKFAMPRQSDSI